METGMLWRDDDQRRTLEEKIERAADYYAQKYGRTPNMCYVNKLALEEDMEIGKMLVKPATNILPQHFWIGMKATRAS